ncbi:MAG: TOMM precursor leader peptide-binding protein [Lacisediminihabitans sp.]
MVLRLDHRYPLVWRSPSDLQFGVDRARVLLTDVSSAEERVIAALLRGISRSGLEMIATDAELPDLDALLAALAPALVAPAEPRATTVAVEGSGTAADLVRARFEEAGIRSSESPDLAVLIAHHVLSPDQHGHWLRRDVPHLPVLFGDQEVHIGPLIEPGRGPCLHCLERHRTDADPARPAIASQLWGRLSHTETPLIAGEVAAIVVRSVLARLEGRPAPDQVTDTAELVLEPATGERRLRHWYGHPGCGCGGLAEPATAALPENDSASAPLRAPIPIGPRRGAAAAARA